jgi:methylated-DNA-[protein]-cysteine S-methyltransferase
MNLAMDPIEQAILAGQILESMTFAQKVWAMTSRIPAGRVTTYGHIARALGSSAPRAVGQALNRNPYAPRVPCHRVVGADGSLTGFAGGLGKKARLLRAEGIPVTNGKVPVDDLFTFDLPATKQLQLFC